MTRRRSYLAIEPGRAKVWREAWDLLLTDRYTLDQICEQLHNRGYTRRSGKPWVVIDPKTGAKRYASSHLQRTFHMAFYAGWVVSPVYGIQRGQIRGHWEPIISDDEFDRGEEILKRHDENKVRTKHYVYVLSGILFTEFDDGTGKHLSKTYGSTPTGRSRSYSYYVPVRKMGGVQLQIPTQIVEDQLVDLIDGLGVAEEAQSDLQALYREHMRTIQGPDLGERIKEVKQRIDRLVTEETALARLFAQGKLTDSSYDTVYREWKGKLFEAHQELAKLESGTDEVIDDLDTALTLLTHVSRLFDRLDKTDQRRLLQILFKRIIIDTQGRICSVELNSPFAYLTALPNAPNGHKGRTQSRLGSGKNQSPQHNEPSRTRDGSSRLEQKSA
jgi:Recombinase